MSLPPPAKRAKTAAKGSRIKSFVISKKLQNEGTIPGPALKLPVNTGSRDERYPEQRHKITLWADRYAAYGNQTPLEWMASQQKQPREPARPTSPVEISDSSSDLELSLPQLPATPQKPPRQELHVYYHHQHTISSSPHKKYAEHDVTKQMVNTIKHHAPGTLVKMTEALEPSKNTTNLTNTDTFTLSELGLTYTYTTADIPEIPALSYAVKDIERLPREWEGSDYIYMKTVPIPLKYWSEIYKHKDTVEYTKRKEVWRRWRVSSKRVLEDSEIFYLLFTDDCCCF